MITKLTSEKMYEYTSEFHRLDRQVPLVLYKPKEKTPRSEIAILVMHIVGDYLSHPVALELAKRGYVTAGANPKHFEVGDITQWLLDYKVCVEFLKSYPGIKKVVLFGHSQAGCLVSCYQYIAENGMDRFNKTERIIPIPDIGPLPGGDGMILADANHGIMDVLAIDPGARNLNNGYARIPELDMFNPDNGYKPNDSHFTPEFIQRFQKAQIDYYNELLAYAKDRYDKIKAGRGLYEDDEPFIIPGAHRGSANNKIFSMDVSLLSRTRNPGPILHADGTVTEDIVHTCRISTDSIPSYNYTRGTLNTTIVSWVMNEKKFDNFGYDASSMWGCDWNFNYMSSRANVKGITIPSLFTGNTGSHEFINTEYNFENSIAEDKSEIFFEGAQHDFFTEVRAETYPGQYGDTLARAADYMAQWIAEPGRFMD